MKVKLSDIAKKTGFSVNTVSRALKGDPRLSEQTKGKINGTAQEMGYIRNYVALSMRRKSTHTLGIVLADISNPFFGEVMLGIEDTARKLGYNILLINTDENPENEFESVRLLIGRQVDGLLSIPVYDYPKNTDLYRSLDIPFIFAGRRVRDLENHCVLHADESGMRLIVEQLIKSGHRRILYIGGPLLISSGIDRLSGYRTALANAGIGGDPALEALTNGHTEDGYQAIIHAVSHGIDFTAVACFNDLVAMGVLKALSETGLRVPDAVEVFGFDNLDITRFMQPRLSTLDVPKYSLGQTAVEELIRHIEDPEAEYKTIELKTRVVLRETTKQNASVAHIHERQS